MFHYYITNSVGRHVDFDRARLLMSRSLLEQARSNIEAIAPQREATLRAHSRESFGWEPRAEKAVFDEHGWLAHVWDEYCRLHRAHYGLPFEPDVSRTWDS